MGGARAPVAPPSGPPLGTGATDTEYVRHLPLAVVASSLGVAKNSSE